MLLDVLGHEGGCVAVSHWCAANCVRAPHYTQISGLVREHRFEGVGME